MKTNAPALLSGNARAWRYTDFDDEGRETLRLDQLDGSPAPEDGEYSADALPPDTSFTMTVSDYAPLAGDTAAAADRATPRTVSRYAVYAGHLPVLIGRTWRTIVRGLRDGIPTVSVRTERAHAQGAALGDPANAVTETVSYEADAPGVPLLLRGRPVAETGEDGVTTHWIHDCGTWDAATRMFTPGTGTGHLRTLSFRTSPEAPQGIPLVATGTLTVEDAVHGNLLFEANLVQVGAGDQGLGIGDFALLDWTRSAYDDQDRLRATWHSDGSWSTNAYSCCRLLWTQDREGRKVLRSAQTGTDHLYYAMEDVYLRDVSEFPYHRATLYFMDALGRETNKVTTLLYGEGDAVYPDCPRVESNTTESVVSFPFGVSGYSIATDIRGNETFSYRAESEAQTSSFMSDGLVTNETVSIRNGRSRSRRSWDGGWTQNESWTVYDANGCLLNYSVTSASDSGSVTNRIVCHDFLGREVSATVPGSNGTAIVTQNAYEGSSNRRLSSTTTGQLPVAYTYDSLGTHIATTRNGITIRMQEIYSCFGDNWWRESYRNMFAGGTQWSSSFDREKVTGLSNALRSHRVSVSEQGYTTVSWSSYNPATKELAKTTAVDNRTPITSIAKYGIEVRSYDVEGWTRHEIDSFGRKFAHTHHPVNSNDTISREYTGYDRLGDVISKDFEFCNDGLQRIASTYAYDGRGYCTRSTDTYGNTTTNVYDSFGNLVEICGAKYPQKFVYDSSGQKTESSTTRDGGTTWDATHWLYDEFTGLCTNKVYADGSRIGYAYADDGKPTRTTWERGAWRETVYDDRGWVVSNRYDSSATPSVERTYTVFGKPFMASDTAGTEYLYGYNSRMTCTNEVMMLAGQPFSLCRGVDNRERTVECFVSESGYADSMKHTVYDAEGRVSQLALTNRVGESAAIQYQYDGHYLSCMTISLANGTEIAHGIVRNHARKNQVLERNVAVNGVTNNASLFEYDLLDRLIVSTNSLAGFCTYGYNHRSEVMGASIGDDSFFYMYDSIGNRIHVDSPSGSFGYIVNCLNQYEIINFRFPTYDADGNLTNDYFLVYDYDAENRMVCAAPIPGNGITRVRNTYDYLHRRIGKIVDTYLNGGWTTTETHTFVYDGWLPVLEVVVNANGTTNTIENFWGPDLSGTEQGAGGIGGLVATSIDGLFYFPAYDHNGNITAYYDAVGNQVAWYVYDAFGNTLSSSGPMANAFPFRFSTKYWDTETGLYYYGYRFYSPKLGRWMNRDPIEERGGANLFLACHNSLVTKVDPFGLVVAKLVSRKENSLLRRIASGDLFRTVEVKTIDDIGIEITSEIAPWGKLHFEHTPTILGRTCTIEVLTQIKIHPKCPKGVVSSVEYMYTPHIPGSIPMLGGNMDTNGHDKYPVPYGAVLAHEKGHANNLISRIMPCINQKLDDKYHGKPVDESDETDIHSIFSECELAKQVEESNDVTTNTVMWFKTAGFGYEIKGGVYVFSKE